MLEYPSNRQSFNEGGNPVQPSSVTWGKPCHRLHWPQRRNANSDWEVFRLVNQIYKRFTPLVEPFGIDELWIDVTGTMRIFANSKKIADTIRGVQ